MNNKLWLVCGLALSANLVVAQQVPSVPAPAGTLPGAARATTNTGSLSSSTEGSSRTAAARASGKSAAAKNPPRESTPRWLELKTRSLVPGPATVVASNVNVRGQARLLGEVVTRLTKGQQVTVLEEVHLQNSGPDEPSAWAKILLPPGPRVWVHAMFIDPATKKVKPRRLNLRAGPGENYSVLGTIERDDTIAEISAKGDWIEIEPPAGAYAFVAAQYLEQGSSAMVAITPQTSTPTQLPDSTPPSTTAATNEVVPTPEPAPTVTTVTEPPPLISPPTDPPSATSSVQSNAVSSVATPPSSGTNAVMTETPPDLSEEEEETTPPRIVQREGVVRGTPSIQAPTRFELFSPESGRTVNYLYATSKELDLSRYKGLRIIVTGEEGLDERWRNTPVLTIQRIQVLE